MLTRVGERLRAWVSARRPHTNVYGLARTLLALGTLGTLLFTDTFDLFRPAAGIPDYPKCRGLARGSLFCVAGRDNLEAAHWISILLLLLVVSGWRPRITGILHWYVTASLFASALMVDGGDQAAAVLTLLLIPVTLTDPRRWHWAAPTGHTVGANEFLPTGTAAAQLITLSSLTVVRLQVAGIYLQAAVSKMRVPEWRDGTAMYYWLTDPWFGLSEPVKGWALSLLANGMVVASMTWAVIMFEIFLFAGLIAERPYRRVLLRLGIAFHAVIALVHGLISFAFSMWAALVLFLYPLDDEIFTLRILWRRFVEAILNRQLPPLRNESLGSIAEYPSTPSQYIGLGL